MNELDTSSWTAHSPHRASLYAARGFGLRVPGLAWVKRAPYPVHAHASGIDALMRSVDPRTSVFACPPRGTTYDSDAIDYAMGMDDVRDVAGALSMATRGFSYNVLRGEAPYMDWMSHGVRARATQPLVRTVEEFFDQPRVPQSFRVIEAADEPLLYVHERDVRLLRRCWLDDSSDSDDVTRSIREAAGRQFYDVLWAPPGGGTALSLVMDIEDAPFANGFIRNEAILAASEIVAKQIPELAWREVADEMEPPPFDAAGVFSGLVRLELRYVGGGWVRRWTIV